MKLTDTLPPRLALSLLLLFIGGEVAASDARNSHAVSGHEVDSMPVGVKSEKASVLKVKPQRGGVTLSWDAVPNAQNYAIYWQPENSQREGGGKLAAKARGKNSKELPDVASAKASPKSVGFGTIRIETANNATSYFHRGHATGRMHYYRVAAIYANGEEGDVSEPMAVISALAKQSQPSDGAP